MLTAAPCLSGQTDPLLDSWRWARFTTRHGLPSNKVKSIVETERSAWAATDRGIAFYDGYQWHAIGPEQGILQGAPVFLSSAPGGEILAESSPVGGRRPGSRLPRAAELTQQLLAFSRKQMSLPKRIDLNEVIADAAAVLEPLLGEKVRCIVAPGSPLGRVAADPVQIHQVLMNLVANARDAMPAGGDFRMETRNVNLDDASAAVLDGIAPGPYVCLAVSDTGTGMSTGTMAHLFEPFFTTKEIGRGTGLGLASVYGVVKQAQGAISVESQLGRGTTFRIYWPRAV